MDTAPLDGSAPGTFLLATAMNGGGCAFALITRPLSTAAEGLCGVKEPFPGAPEVAAPGPVAEVEAGDTPLVEGPAPDAGLSTLRAGGTVMEGGLGACVGAVILPFEPLKDHKMRFWFQKPIKSLSSCLNINEPQLSGVRPDVPESL
jgi:hypothetical protein